MTDSLSVTPQQGTLQKYVDKFADWPAATQQQILGELNAIYRQTCRREDRAKKINDGNADKPKEPSAADAQLPLGDDAP